MLYLTVPDVAELTNACDPKEAVIYRPSLPIPFSLRKVANSALVISYLLMLKALSVTSCWVSSLILFASPAGLPMVNLPAGMETRTIFMVDTTLTVHEAVLLPSAVMAVIMAVPATMAVTKPAELTVALVASVVLQTMLALVALAGIMEAVSCTVPPIVTLAKLLSRAILATVMVGSSFLHELNATHNNKAVAKSDGIFFFISMVVNFDFPFQIYHNLAQGLVSARECSGLVPTTC